MWRLMAAADAAEAAEAADAAAASKSYFSAAWSRQIRLAFWWKRGRGLGPLRR